MRALTVAGVIVSLLAGGVGLLLTLAPKLKRCLGDTNASITDAPVFPRWSYTSYLERNGATPEQAAEAGEQAGALIPISYSVSGFATRSSGSRSLLTVAEDGTLGPVVSGHDNEDTVVFTPQDCSQTGGRNVGAAPGAPPGTRTGPLPRGHRALPRSGQAHRTHRAEADRDLPVLRRVAHRRTRSAPPGYRLL